MGVEQMRLLVTGGAGFIGSNFVRKSLEGKYPSISSIIVLDKLTYAGNLSNFTSEQKSNFQFFHGDICDPKTIKGLIAKVDAVINFAAESHVDRSIKDSKAFFNTNVLGVQTILDVIRNKPETRFVQISTDEVYGSISEGSWDENCPLLPNSPYAASKASAELIIRAYQKTFGLNTVTTRCSNNYGPNHYPEKLIPLFITNLILGRKVPLYGSGLNVRDWLHVDDHCDGIHRALLDGQTGEVYNIGGGRELSNIQITRLILEKFGADESRIEFVPDRLGHDLRYSVDWKKIANELSYKPKVDFELGLSQTIEWYIDNPSWWKPLLPK